MEIEMTGQNGRHAADALPASALETHIGYWLRLVSNEVSDAFARELQKRNVSVAEWVAINQLAAGTLTAARLATAMGMTRGAISKILDRLDSKQLIARSVSPLDSRVQRLALTGRARRLLPSLTRIADDNDSHFFAALDPEERASLQNVLRKLARANQISRIPIE